MNFNNTGKEFYEEIVATTKYKVNSMVLKVDFAVFVTGDLKEVEKKILSGRTRLNSLNEGSILLNCIDKNLKTIVIILPKDCVKENSFYTLIQLNSFFKDKTIEIFNAIKVEEVFNRRTHSGFFKRSKLLSKGKRTYFTSNNFKLKNNIIPLTDMQNGSCNGELPNIL